MCGFLDSSVKMYCNQMLTVVEVSHSNYLLLSSSIAQELG